MKTIVRKDINFEMNKDGKVDIYEKNEKLNTINTPLYAILCMFNGEFTDEEIKKVLLIYGDMEKSENILKLLKVKFKYIFEESNNYKRDLIPFQLTEQHINFSRLRSVVPQVIGISLTHDCFMKCKYCYAGAHYTEKATRKNEMEMSLIRKIIEEMKRFGISTVNLTGGDPFIRYDIFDILEMFKANEIFVDISTKKCFTKSEVDRLATFKDKLKLQISIDSLSDYIQGKMIGVSSYTSNILPIIKKLVDEGLHISTNTVITADNIDGLPDLILELDQLGVKQCTLSPYTNNLWRSNHDLFPSYEQYNLANEKINALTTNIKIQKETYLASLDVRDQKKNIEARVCSAGEDGFIISPKGAVAICERLLYHKEYSIGDLNSQTFLDIWNAEKLIKYYNPSQDEFEGTKCFDCDQFDYCINIRGICYINSLLINEKLFGPDSVCKYYTGVPRIF